VSEFLVISVLSGAGRSTAAATLEDLGWEVIDNLPPHLLHAVGEPAEHVALVVGRGLGEGDLTALEEGLDHLRAQGNRVRTLFLDADDETLVRRFEYSRRRHPLSGGHLADSIARERLLLAPVKEQADVVVETSELSPHDLRDRLASIFGLVEDTRRMRTAVVSFAYSRGIPLDVDLLFDCRFLPNPHWVEELRPHTGLQADVREYVLGQPLSGPFLDRVASLLTLLLPAYMEEGKSYLTVAIGCTGGKHRSVVMAEAVAQLIRDNGLEPVVVHRDMPQ